MPIIAFKQRVARTVAQLVAAFRKGSKSRYVEDRNVRTEYRWAEGDENRLRVLQRPVDCRIRRCHGASAQLNCEKQLLQSRSLISGADPVQLGFVASFNGQGGNATGVVLTRLK
jgi:hypothetical protein